VVNGPLDDGLLREVREEFPSPIAQAARRFQAAPEGSRLVEALNLGQTLIVTLGTISLAWCRHRELRPDGVQNWHERFQKHAPTLGDWLGAAKAGARLAAEIGVPLSGLEKSLSDSASPLSVELEEVLRLRNRYVRSSAGQGAQTVRLATLERHLRSALRGCRFLAGTKFVIIEANEPQRRGGFRVTVRAVAGDNPIFLPAPSFLYPKALFSKTLYLLQEPGDHLEITPFWSVREAKLHNGWELFYLNKRVAKGKGYEYLNFFRPDDSFVDFDLSKAFDWSGEGRRSAGRFKQARSPESLRDPVRGALPSDRIDLAVLFQQTTASMMDAMRVDEETGAKGWNHHLGLPPITALGTAFGLRIMSIVSARFSLFRGDEMVDSLWRHQLPDGTWHCQSQLPTGRPEATAWVLLALCERYDWARAREARWPFERLLQPDHDPALWSHVLSLTLAVPTLSTLAPDSELLERLVSALEDAAVRDDRGRVLYWTPRAQPDADPGAVPSPAHTARALLALQHSWRATDRRVGMAPPELETAVRWLLDQPWGNLYEEIRRPIGVDRFEVLPARHFTSAWAVRALLEFGVDPRHQRIRSTIGELYAGHEDGLWDWDLPGQQSISRPVWATLDALRALEAYVRRASRF
jgi:hypothetical protein